MPEDVVTVGGSNSAGGTLIRFGFGFDFGFGFGIPTTMLVFFSLITHFMDLPGIDFSTGAEVTISI